MECSDVIETENSLIRINKVCRMICTFIKVAFVVFCICWLFVAAFMIGTFSGQALGEIATRVLLHLVRGAVIAVLFAVLIGIFSDAAKGESPFTMKQAKRLRLISYVLIVYGVLEIVFSANDAIVYYEGINAGFVSTEDSAIITFNFAPFIAAAVVFAFSYVFKYGVLLQELSDETL